MRRGSQEAGFSIDEENNNLLGVSLGFDFCAEHEWGTKPLRDAFGVGEESDIGLESRKTTRVPKHFYFRTREVDGKPEAMLIHSDFWKDDEESINKTLNYNFGGSGNENSELSSYDNDWEFISAWSENDFAIKVRGEEGVKRLEEVYEAFKNNNIVFGMKPAALSRGGLFFGIYSNYDEEFKAAVLEQDREALKLEEFVEKSGIRQELREAKCRYFALSQPRWADETKTEVRMWLNPMEQDKNNCGWFSISELRQWIKGEGPIPKKNKAMA